MPTIPLKGLGQGGLNTDVPAQALDHSTFSDGNNLRPFDGSLQATFDFTQVVEAINGTASGFTPASGVAEPRVRITNVAINVGDANDSRVSVASYDENDVNDLPSDRPTAIYDATPHVDVNGAETTVVIPVGNWVGGDNSSAQIEIPFSEQEQTVRHLVKDDDNVRILTGRYTSNAFVLGPNVTALTCDPSTTLQNGEYVWISTQGPYIVQNANGHYFEITHSDSDTLRGTDLIGRNLRIAKRNGLRPIHAMTQWTPTGSDDLNLAYLWDEASDIDFQIVTSLTGSGPVAGLVAPDTGLSSSNDIKIDLFDFNGVLIVNDGVSQPIVINPPGSPSNSGDKPETNYVLGWLIGGATDFTGNIPSSLAANTDTAINYATGRGTGSVTFNSSVALSSTEAVTSFINEQHQVNMTSNRVTAKTIVPYRNRLVALNVTGPYLSDKSNDVTGNSSIFWSTPITQLETLNGVTFLPASNNSAGDDIITETSGEIIDGGQLGEYLIVYKEGSVFQYTDVGDPLYLVGRLIFDDDGLYTKGAWADIGSNRHFVVGNYGIYIHDGGVNKKNVSRGKIEQALFNDVVPANRDDTFVFHHTADKEVWVCINTGSTRGRCNKAYCYNYEQDTWYTRELPSVRGITEGEVDGQLYIYGWGDFGPRRLYNERENSPVYTTGGYVQFNKHDLGVAHQTKHVYEVYPMCSEQIGVGLRAYNQLQMTGSLDNTDRTFNPADHYHMDYRLNGRFFDMRLAQSGTTNPKITGFDLEVKPGGHR